MHSTTNSIDAFLNYGGLIFQRPLNHYFKVLTRKKILLGLYTKLKKKLTGSLINYKIYIIAVTTMYLDK